MDIFLLLSGHEKNWFNDSVFSQVLMDLKE